MIGSLSPSSFLVIRDTGTPKGRGVYTSRRYLAGERVEISPVLLVQSSWLDLPTEIRCMVYDWGVLTGDAPGKTHAIALGAGSLFNHASPSVLSFEADADQRALVFTALTDIPEGAELTIDYNADIPAGFQSGDWFEAMGISKQT